MKQELDDNRPIYIQIKEMIEDAILSGSIPIGERVPSTNELSKFYQINPATARQGMNELVQENILKKQRGVGMFVTESALEVIRSKRKKDFMEQFILPLKEEANKLNISNEQILAMLKEERKDGN